MNTSQRSIGDVVKLPSLAHVTRTIGMVLLRVLTVLMILLLAVPVALLPVTTPVPALIWIVLAVADLALAIALVRFAFTWRAATAMLIGFIVVAGVAVAASQRLLQPVARPCRVNRRGTDMDTGRGNGLQ